MSLILTNHAKKRIIERAVKLEEIQEAINFPDYAIKKQNIFEAHKNLKIIYSPLGKFIKIITVIIK